MLTVLSLSVSSMETAGLYDWSEKAIIVTESNIVIHILYPNIVAKKIL